MADDLGIGLGHGTIAALLMVTLASASSGATESRMTRDLAIVTRDKGTAQPRVPRVYPKGKYWASSVLAIVPDGRGGWFVGGSWNRIGSVRCPNLAHVLASQRVDPGFCPRPENDVSALARVGTRLYVGGRFTRIAGVNRNYLAALDTRSGSATPWDLQLGVVEPRYDRDNPIPGSVDHLVRSKSSLYVSGEFDRAGGERRLGMARFDLGTGSLSTWSAAADLRSPASVVAGNSQLYVGGGYEGNVRVVYTGTGVVRVMGARVRSQFGSPGNIIALALRGNTLYAGGEFDRVNGRSQLSLVALDARTGRLRGWAPTLHSSGEVRVDVLALTGSTLFVGGWFERVSGVRRRGLAALDVALSRVLPWQPTGPVDGFGVVAAIAATQNRVAVGCAFCD